MGEVVIPKLRFWPLFFLLTIAEGIIAFVNLVLIPSEEVGGLLGFSLTRLAFMLGLVASVVFLAVLLFLSWRKKAWREKWLNPQVNVRYYILLTMAATAGALIAGGGLFLLRYYNPERLLPLFIRARPLLFFLMLFCAQLSLWLLVLKNGVRLSAFSSRKGVYIATLIILAVLLTIWGIVALTRLGLNPDPGYWAEPGVPLLGWQVALAIICGWLILLIGLSEWIERHIRFFDGLLGMGLWGIAVSVWMSVPLSVLNSSFYAPIIPPYKQPFPYSDAGMYDYLARGLLLGNGFIGTIPPRPLYIVFLAGLHRLFGNDYGRVIFGQTFVLAFLPVVLFFLGKRLHSRAAGFTVGLLAIFRELTTLWVSSATRVSNSKLLLSDLPTTLAISAFLLFAIHWFSKKEKRHLNSFLAGGFFGLLLLLRTQSMFLIPGLVLVGLLSFRCSWKQWLFNALVFSIGVSLSIFPWLGRNWQLTGSPTLEDPTQVKVLASLYTSADLNYAGQSFANSSVGEAVKVIIDVSLHRSGDVAGFITNHFMANEIDTLLVLPLVEKFDGLLAPINTYWLNWNGSLANYNVLLLFGYLILIAVGLAAAWKRLRWVGWFPLVFTVFYALSDGVGRISGWRYILPVDWVGYFYFGIGVVEILGGMVVMIGGNPQRVLSTTTQIPSRTSEPSFQPALPNSTLSIALKVGAASAFFLLIGSLPWVLEHTIPLVFRESDPITVIQKMAASPAVKSAGLTASQIQTFTDQAGAVIRTGQLLYPRLFWADEGLRSANPWAAYAPRDYPRFGFILLYRQGVAQVVLPVKAELSELLPPDSDVILLGCNRSGYLEVRMLLVQTGDILFQGGKLGDECGSR